MASDAEFVAYVLEQLEQVGFVTARKLFGEYGLYNSGKIFGSICDNKLFIKPTEAGRAFLGEDLVEAPPYPGAKPNFLIEEGLAHRAWLCELVQRTVAELPAPKKKAKKNQQPKKDVT